MIIKDLTANNILNLNTNIELNHSISISGLSGSGKTTFCEVISNESLKRVVTLLPKSEYRFLFSEFLRTNFSAQNIKDIPLSFFLEKASMPSNVRSTVGTHTTIFKNIRKILSKKYKCPSEFFEKVYLAQRPDFTTKQLNHTAEFTDKHRGWEFMFIPAQKDVDSIGARTTRVNKRITKQF